MLNISHIASQVKRNCDISDARYWGFYSPCGLLLRLRDLYKIENGLSPWEGVRHETIGTWIDRREKLWHEIENHDFQDIKIMDKKYRPFDVRGINSVLVRHGYLYGAGYGNLLKPMFLLAKLDTQSRLGRYDIYVSGREIARCLSTAPAMIQGNKIIARFETMSLFLWHKFEEMKTKKCNSALYHAYSAYGISRSIGHDDSPKKLEKIIGEITREELSTYVHHELGEASQRSVLGQWWKEMLFKLPYSRAEMFLRGLKDILADTCSAGMLNYIIKNEKKGSLGFYVSLLTGFRKIIFPDIISAYGDYIKRGNWNVIEEARVKGYKKAGDYVRRLKEMSDEGRISPEIIEEEIMPKVM